MKKLVEYQLEKNGSIFIEVEETEAIRGITRVARGEEAIPEKATTTFEEALDKVKPVAISIVQKFRELGDRPDEVQIEFGLKMNAKAGAIISSGGIEANFKVALKWVKE